MTNRLTEAELDHITDYTNGGNSPQCLMSVDLHRLLATARENARLQAERDRLAEALEKIADAENPEHYGNARDAMHNCKIIARTALEGT